MNHYTYLYHLALLHPDTKLDSASNEDKQFYEELLMEQQEQM